MECPAPGSKLADIARRTAQVCYGVNVNHKCTIGTCRFVACPLRNLKRNNRAARLMVCSSSLHVHWCGVDVCSLVKEQAIPTDGPWVCPISRLEITGQAEVYCPQRRRGRGSRPDQFVHSQTTAPRKSVCRSRAKAGKSRSRLAETQRFVTMLLASKESEALIIKAAQRREKHVHAKVSKAGTSFMAQMLAARTVCPRLCLPPASPENLTSISIGINNFLERVRPRMSVSKGNASQIAACVGFLSTGISTKHTVIVPRLDWVARRLPEPADLGKLPGFQCRPVSISARHIKAAVFGAKGDAIATMLFRLPAPFRN